jgi:hypothetical protein
MTSLNSLIDDDITTVNETTTLLVQPQQTTSAIPRTGPRHSISWVKFYSIISNK